MFRKIVNGVLQALGPVGDVFEWLLDRGEALASDLWREAVLAVRFVKKSVDEILDWAADAGRRRVRPHPRWRSRRSGRQSVR